MFPNTHPFAYTHVYLLLFSFYQKIMLWVWGWKSVSKIPFKKCEIREVRFDSKDSTSKIHTQYFAIEMSKSGHKWLTPVIPTT
jgi:hypothetical protein